MDLVGWVSVTRTPKPESNQIVGHLERNARKLAWLAEVAINYYFAMAGESLGTLPYDNSYHHFLHCQTCPYLHVSRKTFLFLYTYRTSLPHPCYSLIHAGCMKSGEGIASTNNIPAGTWQ
jgi:hypothetical protein